MRVTVERGAAELQVKPTQFAYVDAVDFARALGAARSGKPDAAKADIATLAELSARLPRLPTIGRRWWISSARSRPRGSQRRGQRP